MSVALHHQYQARLAADRASQRSLETLLNCYCREVAGPEKQVSIGSTFGANDWPQSLRMALTRGCVLHVLLPEIDTRIVTVVERPSATSNYRYCAPVYYKPPGRPWAMLDGWLLPRLLIESLSKKFGTEFNYDLLAQIRDSVDVTAAILTVMEGRRSATSHLDGFMDSEQSLTYGHPFHPAPKSRQGFTADDLLNYSPEVGARFPLHYFAVRREYLSDRSLLPEPCNAHVGAMAPHLDLPEDFAVLPVHPWQARYLNSHPVVVEALRHDRLRDLGPGGEDWIPTSSIRTLYHPAQPYFLKLSLNVRVTNCVRKNAPYELEGALAVTGILRQIQPALAALFPSLSVMEEPAWQSADLPHANPQWRKEIVEGFGLILRQGIGPLMEREVTPVLSGALFGNHLPGQARLHGVITAYARAEGLTWSDAAVAWFDRYAGQLIAPVLYCFFHYGIIFEPHLQNVVVGLRRHAPVQIFLRDFEGVKLVPERFPETRLADISPRAREALWYGRDQGWNRIAYCLFVNHLAEAIDQISLRDASLERLLWGRVRYHIGAFQSQFGHRESAVRLNAVLAGEPLPAKANLINRFLKRPDRAVTYVPLPNPLLHASEEGR